MRFSRWLVLEVTDIFKKLLTFLNWVDTPMRVRLIMCTGVMCTDLVRYGIRSVFRSVRVRIIYSTNTVRVQYGCINTGV